MTLTAKTVTSLSNLYRAVLEAQTALFTHPIDFWDNYTEEEIEAAEVTVWEIDRNETDVMNAAAELAKLIILEILTEHDYPRPSSDTKVEWAKPQDDVSALMAKELDNGKLMSNEAKRIAGQKGELEPEDRQMLWRLERTLEVLSGCCWFVDRVMELTYNDDETKAKQAMEQIAELANSYAELVLGRVG